ncbi:MAG: amidophosphoribosyltransferase, partial [Fibrobacterota bacterium]
MSDIIYEECGIAGVCGNGDTVPDTLLALHALQHRGQESAGVAVNNSGRILCYKKMGLVSRVTQKIKNFDEYSGPVSIGHARYSTTGFTNLVNSQPILVDYKDGQLAIAHNGNIVNAAQLRRQMEKNGSIFQSTNDSEIILHLLARSRKRSLIEKLKESFKKLKGAFSLVLLNKDVLIASRDPLGIRPLCFGVRDDNSYVIASETCALDIVNARYVRDIDPGEILVFRQGEPPVSHNYSKSRRSAHCVFEYIYFSRPDSRVFGQNVDKIRRFLGKKLAEESPVDADIVISVPDSSNTAALGYASESGIPFEIGLIRNHYVGRTFISPKQNDRENKVKIKFNTVRGVLKGKRVVVVDDSIVRGTTLKKLVELIKTAGTKEIHLRISSPPV